jgi:hypothetical protein
MLVFLSLTGTTVYQDHKTTRDRLARAQRVIKKLEATVNEKVESAKSDCAVRSGAVEILQGQIQSQQTTINNCLLQLGKSSQAAVPQLTVLTEPATPDPKMGKHSRQILVLVDKTVSRARGILSCNKAINHAYARVFGGGMQVGGAADRPMGNIVPFDITMPNVSPVAPLMFTIFYDDVTLESCSVGLQNVR